MKVLFEYNNHDFLPWLEEKNDGIIHNCYCLLENCTDEESRFSISAALHNALIIMFAINEKLEGCNDLIEYLLDINYKEFQKWSVLFSEPDRDKKYEFSDKGIVDKEIVSFITEDGWDKSRIPEKINHRKSKDPDQNKWLIEIENDYEEVVMGNVPWRTFYECHHDDYNKFVRLYSFNDLIQIAKRGLK